MFMAETNETVAEGGWGLDHAPQRQVASLREAANSLPLTVKAKPFAQVINGPLRSRVVLAGTPGFCLLTPPGVRRP